MTEGKVPNLFKVRSLKEEVLIRIVFKVVSRLRTSASACPHRSPKRLSSRVKPRQRGREKKSKNEEDRGRARRDRDCLTY